MENYNELIKNLETLEDQKKAIEKQIDNIKNIFKKVMDQTETMETENFIIKYTLCEKSTIKIKELEMDHPDIYKNYLNSTLYRRFSYKAI